MAVIAGPENPTTAKAQAPRSWRTIYGLKSAANAVHVSENLALYEREANFLFSDAMRIQGFTALLNNCSLCLIKPHAMKYAGLIIDRILDEGFEISAMQSQFLERTHAEEFLELYKVVLQDINETID